MTIEREELKGNIAVSVSDNEVRLWVCNDEGMSIYRFKALGKVYKASDGEIIIGALPMDSLVRIHDALAELAVEKHDEVTGQVAHDTAKALRIKIGDIAEAELEAGQTKGS